MLRISHSLTSASLSAIFTGLDGRSALKLSRPATLKQTNTSQGTDEAQERRVQRDAGAGRALQRNHTQKAWAGVTKPEHTLSHTLGQVEVLRSGFWDGFLGRRRQSRRKFGDQMEFKGSNVFRFFYLLVLLIGD